MAPIVVLFSSLMLLQHTFPERKLFLPLLVGADWRGFGVAPTFILLLGIARSCCRLVFISVNLQPAAYLV